MKNYLIDLDGTIYAGTKPIEFAKEFISYLKSNNRKFLFATNCPLNSISALVSKLNSMDIDCDSTDFINCSMATCDYLNMNFKNKKVFAIASPAFRQLLIENNINLVENDADVVVVGYDTNVTYAQLKNACLQVLKNAQFIATNPDNTIPFLDSFIPHTGANISFIQTATGKAPIIIGKPEKYMLDTACKILNCEKSSLCVIGDRLDTDIAFAVNNNIDGYLVLTGTVKEINANMSPKPTMIFNNLNEIMNYERRN